MPAEHHVRVRRTARYFTLGPEEGAARELWFVLHGYGTLAKPFLDVFAAIDDGTRLLVAPEALNRCYTVPPAGVPAHERPVGATWMTREDREREIADYVAYLDDVAADVSARLTPGAAVTRVVVLGFSQGTATAARWLTHGQIRAHHLVLWGGMLPPELELHRRDHPVRRVCLTFAVGSGDHFATPEVIRAEEEKLERAGVPYAIHRYAGRHAIPRAELPVLAAALAAR